MSVTTSAHCTREDKTDVQKVLTSILTNELLEILPGRKHSSFNNIHINPLWNWEKQRAIEWIERKKKDFGKYKSVVEELSEEQPHEEDSDQNSDDTCI